MSYTLTIIDNPKDPTFNQLLSINDIGEIAGYFGSGTPPTTHPNKGYTVTLVNGSPVFVDENYPLSMQTQVTGVNNAGQTIGFEIDAAGNSYGFVDNNGVFSIAVDPRAKAIGGVVTEQFLGENDRDQVAGFYNKANGSTAGFIYNELTGAFSNVSISNATSVTATDINDKGEISGFFTRNGNEKGFVDINGKILVLSHPGWTDIQALGLNNAGLVVGSYVDHAGNTDGFTYNMATGVYRTIIKGAGTETVINGVNDLGDLVGFYMDAAGKTHGMLLTPPPPTPNPQALTIDNLTDPTFNQLLAINNAGEIAGYFGSGASGHPNKGYTATLQNGAPVFVNENYPGSTQTQVTGINNAGVTVGFEIDAAGNSGGWVEQPNGAFQLAIDPSATLGGEQFLGVNDRNQVAGFYTADAAGDTAGFIYNDQSGVFTPVVPKKSATSVTATDINDAGDISGFFTNKNGNEKGFVEIDGSTTVLSHPGWKDIQALGLNNDGLVVGSYMKGMDTFGFIYSVSSNSFTSYTAPGDLGGQTVLNGINDLNQAVGFYMDAQHNTHGLLVNNV
jgi:hypothetical protein